MGKLLKVTGVLWMIGGVVYVAVESFRGRRTNPFHGSSDLPGLAAVIFFPFILPGLILCGIGAAIRKGKPTSEANPNFSPPYSKKPLFMA
jgi:hypothetical protein